MEDFPVHCRMFRSITSLCQSHIVTHPHQPSQCLKSLPNDPWEANSLVESHTFQIKIPVFRSLYHSDNYEASCWGLGDDQIHIWDCSLVSPAQSLTDTCHGMCVHVIPISSERALKSWDNRKILHKRKLVYTCICFWLLKIWA